jgi:hypothetical protein
VSRVVDLDEAIRNAGIPIEGVSYKTGGTPRIDFKPGATPAQRNQAQALADAFDFTPKQPFSMVRLVNDILALAPADQTKLFAAVAAQVLRAQPDFARKVGIALDGEH